ELVPGTGTLLFYLPNGTRVTREASEQEHCCYRGAARGVPGSWASLCACAGLSGSIQLSDTQSYGLEPDTGSPPGRHVAYRLLAPRACGQDPLGPPQAEAEDTEPPLPRRGKRAPPEQRFVELVMVVDHSAVSAGARGDPAAPTLIPPLPTHPSAVLPSSRTTPTSGASA
ncbi:ADA15 protein, partial [Zapornia atra]|nr:ADA15 protein [Zapornia atra]